MRSAPVAAAAAAEVVDSVACQSQGSDKFEIQRECFVIYKKNVMSESGTLQDIRRQADRVP